MMRRTVLGEHPTRRMSARRRGSILAEVAMATVMLMIAMTLTVQVLGYAGRQRRSADQRQRAASEAANILERLSASPYDELSPRRAGEMALPRALGASIPGAELAVDVAEESPGAGQAAKRIAVRIRWRGRSGEWEAPVRLTTWVFKDDKVTK